MKNFLLLLFTLSTVISCTAPKHSMKYNKNREMLKELFLYKCISYGYPEIELSKYDNSAATYLELSHYAPSAYSKIDSLAKVFVSKIEYKDTYYEDQKTKGIFMLSLEYFKSKEFNNFIESLDRYMSK